MHVRTDRHRPLWTGPAAQRALATAAAAAALLLAGGQLGGTASVEASNGTINIGTQPPKPGSTVVLAEGAPQPQGPHLPPTEPA